MMKRSDKASFVIRVGVKVGNSSPMYSLKVTAQPSFRATKEREIPYHVQFRTTFDGISRQKTPRNLS